MFYYILNAQCTEILYIQKLILSIEEILFKASTITIYYRWDTASVSTIARYNEACRLFDPYIVQNLLDVISTI